MKYVIFITMLAVLKESHPLNPEILEYDHYMNDFEATGRQMKHEAKDKETQALVMKRESPYPDSGYNIKWIEKQFLAHLIPGLTYHSSKLAQWSRDKQEALCLRAMNNTFQFHGGKTTTTATKTLKFRWERHEPIKVDVIVCPAPNRCIYENRRYRDCYVVLARDEYKNDSPDELYILYERSQFDYHCVVTAEDGKAVKKLETEFIKSGKGSANNKTWNTVISKWNLERMQVLCVRALFDRWQMKISKPPVVVERTVIFKHQKHKPVNVSLLKCPTGLQKFIFESPRESDCYLIITEEENSKIHNDTIFIEKEVCGCGMM